MITLYLLPNYLAQISFRVFLTDFSILHHSLTFELLPQVARNPQAAGIGVPSLIKSAEKLPLPSDREIPPVKIVASRSHYSPETERYVEEIQAKFGEIDLVNAGSSLKICLVAEGTADVYPRFGPTMEWDVAAGQIIAEEAGCTVVEAQSGAPLRYNK